MQIQILGSNQATIYRTIRLEGLQKHPEAFASSYEEEVEFSIGKFESRLNEEASYTFGAFDRERLLGVVTLVIEKKSKLKHRAHIFAMYVNPESRKLGIGKSLMLAAIEKAKTREGIEQVYLTVTSSNETAKKLYQSLGFEKYGEDKRALKVNGTYFDEDLMVLYL